MYADLIPISVRTLSYEACASILVGIGNLESVMNRRRRVGSVQHEHEYLTPSRKADPIDVSDEEWTLVAPYLTLVPEDDL